MSQSEEAGKLVQSKRSAESLDSLDSVDSIDALIRREHGVLDELFSELMDKLTDTLAQNAAPGPAQRALARLRETLERHLLQEERLYYTALRSLAPAHHRALQGFEEAHAQFRTQLAALGDEMQRPPAKTGETTKTTETAKTPETARALLDSITRDFARHEADEEALLGEIDRELRARARSLRSP
ncbi:hemerythrin domain-containing protein [Myxococcota bacterium]|nr:hemerythrin domain-containing protein [Myxococcota bacterium]MCZ7617565.1 hemerythrin domain-containing protein [Myxococcota bacterium]